MRFIMNQAFLLAIDGGQTSTKAMVATVEGEVLGAGSGGPTIHYLAEGGPENNRAAVQEAIRAALAVSGNPDPAAFVAAGLGSTGVDPEGEEVPLIHDIISEVVSPAHIQVTTDTYTNLMGASGGEPGVVVIAGGGGIGFGIDRNGNTAISNGFGYWIGDEGSAFWIGMQAIHAACRASDRRGPATVLERIVQNHFELETMRKLPRVVYRAGFRRDRISQLAPLVATAARQGDSAAIAIYERAAEEMALTAVGVIRQLYSPGDAAVVYPTGGVFANDDLMREPFEMHLARLWPEAEVRSPRFPPVVGGLIVAARLANLTIDTAWLDRVEGSIGR